MGVLTIAGFLGIVWLLMAAGRAVTGRIGLPSYISILEKNLLGYALGLVIFAYGMLVIGLFGGLYVPVALVWLALLGLLGITQWLPMLREMGSILGTCFHPPGLVWLTMALLAFFNGLSLIGCFSPPVLSLPTMGYTEWDSLSYHLADPKIYVLAHRISPIWWEHHSNFAFTGEMWYAFALLFNNAPLAKLFHWSCGLAASLAVYRIALRFLGMRAAALATILFASTPIVFWEAGTAYVDLVATYFGAVTLLALAAGMAERNEKWLLLSAVFMGLMLSSKATALVTLALFAGALLYYRWRVLGQTPRVAVARVAVWCVLALIIGSPWYLKSIAYTGNPVYPFYYKVFGGKYWTAEDAANYEASNAIFGVGHQPVNLIMAPWNVVMYLMPGHPAPLYPFLAHGNTGAKPFNDYPSELVTFSPVLLAVLFVPAFFFRRRRISPTPVSAPQGVAAPPLPPETVAPALAVEASALHPSPDSPALVLEAPTDEITVPAPAPYQTPGFIKGLALYALAAFALWFVPMQYARYLIPMLPAFCILAAWVIDRALALRTMTGVALAGMTMLSVLCSGYIGVSLAQVQLPVVTGQVSSDEYIEKGFAGYPAMQYINRRLPADSKIVFYNCPTGFYCDKAYLWGDKTHSAYIPYDQMHSATDLLKFFQKIHVTHILVSTRQFNFPWPPSETDAHWLKWTYALTGAASQPVFSDEHGFQLYELPPSEADIHG